MSVLAQEVGLADGVGVRRPSSEEVAVSWLGGGWDVRGYGGRLASPAAGRVIWLLRWWQVLAGSFLGCGGGNWAWCEGAALAGSAAAANDGRTRAGAEGKGRRRCRGQGVGQARLMRWPSRGGRRRRFAEEGRGRRSRRCACARRSRSKSAGSWCLAPVGPFRGRRRPVRRRLQGRSAPRAGRGLVRAGLRQQAVVAGAVQARGQDVQHDAPQKLRRAKTGTATP